MIERGQNVYEKYKRERSHKASSERSDHNATNNKKGSIIKLEVPVESTHNPKTCTNWKIIDLPDEIKEHLIQ
jgi:hypothetical protein